MYEIAGNLCKHMTKEEKNSRPLRKTVTKPLTKPLMQAVFFATWRPRLPATECGKNHWFLPTSFLFRISVSNIGTGPSNPGHRGRALLAVRAAAVGRKMCVGGRGQGGADLIALHAGSDPPPPDDLGSIVGSIGCLRVCSQITIFLFIPSHDSRVGEDHQDNCTFFDFLYGWFAEEGHPVTIRIPVPQAGGGRPAP